jgi:hypothetical protein
LIPVSQKVASDLFSKPPSLATSTPADKSLQAKRAFLSKTWHKVEKLIRRTASHLKSNTPLDQFRIAQQVLKLPADFQPASPPTVPSLFLSSLRKVEKSLRSHLWLCKKKASKQMWASINESFQAAPPASHKTHQTGRFVKSTNVSPAGLLNPDKSIASNDAEYKAAFQTFYQDLYNAKPWFQDPQFFPAPRPSRTSDNTAIFLPISQLELDQYLSTLKIGKAVPDGPPPLSFLNGLAKRAVLPSVPN